MMGWQKDCGNTPRCKEMDWQSFKQEDSTFYFVRNHFESIGKPILLKWGKVLLVNKMLHVHKRQSPKTPTSSSTKVCPKPNIQNRCNQQFPLGATDSQTQTDPCQTLASRCNRFCIGATEFSLQLSVTSFHKIGLTEFFGSASPSCAI